MSADSSVTTKSPASDPVKSSRWNHCNVYRVAPDARQLWQFSPTRDGIAAGTSETLPIDRNPSPALVAKDWRSVLQPRLNIALLPARHVFLRALSLPACEPAELANLVEFQLERISPLPPTHVVWTAESLGSRDGKEQTVIVAIAQKSQVEEFLGSLEGQGYLADRLEIPMVRELRAQVPTPDGIWVLLEPEPDRVLCLTAWWTGGQLRELALNPLPPGAAMPGHLIQQLSETAWAGEMAGWWNQPAPVRLVAPQDLATAVEPELRTWNSLPVEMLVPRPAAKLAELTAFEALQASNTIPLIPAEVSARYRQRWIDYLWIKSLSAIGLAYLFGTLAYLGALKFRTWQTESAEIEARDLGKAYTNTLQLRQQVAVLQEQINLKYAALDSWRAAVDNLPAELTLGGLTFERGRTLALDGSAPAGSAEQVTAFNSALKKVVVNGQPLFANVEPAQVTVRGNDSTWRFKADLKRTESP